MKKDYLVFIVIFVIVLFIGFFVLSSNSNKKNNKKNKEEEKQVNLLTGKHYVEIDIKKYGKIKLELDADVAPITVTNFINLVNDGFYDGLTFHRIIAGFMIQGGGYEVDGTRKNSPNIKGEFAQNGVKNNILHKRGVISMARATNPNSASSEFFIMHEDDDYLDGKYAAFGHVISGIEVVDKIANSAKPIDNNGSILEEDRPVINYIKVIEK